ncbi:hypothetical protein SAMN05216351_101323 [Pseudobutyrivibrio sp. JW11]|uniref:phage baseplate assembly protein V n=1 Tax=Pseudobutyrivibrio sp. JW11 TaxID=1855302 RepID=UPI0008E67006|nr:phage baseplate assembly protein V [Pseudobutyrivibrio sp. JW11]SFN83688.1 hypothetical protein SAMN05216351_101323 [Pseudobutyrivibrio sp. JW11]
MGLYDVIDDIANKQILKTETGDNRIFGVVIGLVVSNYDKDHPGKICVSIPMRDKDANELKWAKMVQMSSGKNWGTYFLPEVGDQVMLVFDHGIIDKPYVIGCVPKDNDSFFTKAADDKNRIKRITTKNGSTIEFTDNDKGDGEKDAIAIKTATNAYEFHMDNEKKEVYLSDKDKENQIVMNTESGKMTVKAKKNLTVEVGDNISLIMNGETGKVTLKTKKLLVEASEGADIKSDRNVNVAGAKVKIEGNSSTEVSSSGSTKIAGNMISMG